ncbi:MAG: radical SAM protein, partial [Thermacetogeniaceae bacterium]
CCAVIERCKSAGLPISGLLTPTAMRGKGDLMRTREAGADRVGIAIDAATEGLFERHRGSGVNGPHRWDRYWEAVAEAVEVFGRYRVGVHLIVGLGETEEEMVKAITRAHRMGALTHLFSFFPESGSLLEKHPQPSLGQYRRVQLARYLINEGLISGEEIRFSPEGRILDYGIDIEPYLSEGLAFMTSGCPGEDGLLACNRPFGNERASEPIRNFPFVPTKKDLEEIRSQLWEGASDGGA